MPGEHIIGLDLTKYEAQLCRYNGAGEVESVMVTAGGSRAAFPGKLSLLPADKKWKYGIEADYFITHKDALEVPCIYDICYKGRSVELAGEKYEAWDLLATFITLALTSAGITDPENEVVALTVTVPKISREFARAASKAFAKIGFNGDQAAIRDHAESFYYHSINQELDLINKNAALYYFPDDYQVEFLSIGANQTKPVTIVPRAKGEKVLSFEETQRDEEFLGFVRETMESGEFSAAFLVGSGFDRSWAKESLAMLCRGKRKVFYGNNLFAKGACYDACMRAGVIGRKDCLFIGSDLVSDNIGMEMMIDGEPGYKPLIKAGVNWYEAENEIEFLLNDETDLIFRVSSMTDGVRRKFKMQLPGLPDRPAKTTRIRLNISYAEAGRCVIEAKDLGFGEFFESSGLTWTEEYTGDIE